MKKCPIHYGPCACDLTDNGGPAFPDVLYANGLELVQHGITMRSYIAAKNMAAMCSTGTWPSDDDWKDVARRAVIGADALIEALKER